MIRIDLRSSREIVNNQSFDTKSNELRDFKLMDLHFYDIRQILSFLSENDLLNLRLVSKQIKLYVENELKLCKRALNITKNYKCLKEIDFITSLFPRIDTLRLTSWAFSTEQLISTLANNLKSVVNLSLNGLVDSTYLSLISSSFNQLRVLDIAEMNVDDQDVLRLLKGLKYLEKIKIGSEYSKNRVTGKCFADCGQRLSVIKWTVDRRVTFRSNLSLNGGAENVKELSLLIPYGKNENNLQVAEFIAREMPNLQKLRLELCDVQLNGLESLKYLNTLRIDGYIGNPIVFTRKLKSVKKLSIDGYGQTDDQMAHFLRYFPNLIDLKIALNRKEPHDTNVLISSICSMPSLRIFSLKDECYEFDEQRFHFYTNLISALKSLHVFNLAFEYNISEDNRNLLIALAEKRLKQSFFVVFEDEKRTNEKIVFESSNLLIKRTSDNKAQFVFKDHSRFIKSKVLKF